MTSEAGRTIDLELLITLTFLTYATLRRLYTTYQRVKRNDELVIITLPTRAVPMIPTYLPFNRIYVQVHCRSILSPPPPTHSRKLSVSDVTI